jgi:hypothetical protein
MLIKKHVKNINTCIVNLLLSIKCLKFNLAPIVGEDSPHPLNMKFLAFLALLLCMVELYKYNNRALNQHNETKIVYTDCTIIWIE